MKLVFSSYDSLKNPFYSGGGAFAIHEVARRLAQTHSVTVLAGAYPGAKNQIIDSVHYIYVGSRVRHPLLSQALYFISLWRHVFTQAFDIWLESFTPPVSTSCLQILTRKPVIGVAHNLCAKDMKKKYKVSFDLIENIGLRTYKKIIVLTESQKQKITQSGSKAVVIVCPNASSINSKKVSALKSRYNNKKYFLFIGRIDIEQKGLDLLFAAFSKVVGEIEEDLYIAGAGTKSEEKKLLTLLRRYRLTNRVKILGKVVGDEKKDVVQHAKAMLFPSRFEGQGLTFLEALQHDKVIACFNTEDVDWLDDSLCIKIERFDVDTYAKCIVRLSKDTSFRKKIESKIHTHKKAYMRSWDQVTKVYRKVIEESLE